MSDKSGKPEVPDQHGRQAMATETASVGNNHSPVPSQDFRARQPQSFEVNRKRRRELDWEDTRRPAWVAWVSVLCVVALFVAVLALAQSDRISKPQNVNGDQLGPYDLSRADYDKEAEKLIGEMQGEQARWALVSPETAASAEDLNRLFQGMDGLRVSTLMLGPIQWPIPEPAKGETREAVFQQAVGTMSQGSGLRAQDIRFDGVLVHGTPEQLRRIDATEGILAVEPAHPEAVYGRIGIRPLSPPESEQSAPAPDLAQPGGAEGGAP